MAAITNIAGPVIERLAYDPWGKRRQVNGADDVLDAIVPLYTERGYTLHEHLDEMGVIHMNGRIYDPLMGRFMSADPYIQSPDELQSFNRYAYVLNNPLSPTDPSGYWSFRSLFRAVAVVAIGIYAPQFLGSFVTSLGGSFVTMSGGTIFSSSVGLSTLGSVAVGAAGGFAIGAVATGNLKGAMQGAISGALFGAAGTVGGANGADTFGRYAAHAGAGCIGAVAGGGSCGSGAVSAVFGKFTTNQLNQQFQGTGWESDIAKGVATAVAGGVGSVIAGGAFDNGAATAAFGYLFNQVLSRGAGLLGRSPTPVNDPLDPETLERRTNRGFVALDRLMTRAEDSGPQEYQYSLVAQRDGMYPNVRTPGVDMYLNAGDVWKIGTSVDPDHRYPLSYLGSLNVRMVPETTGSAFQVLVQEKLRLLGYMMTNFNLPPGNKILK